jgi:hypothetical protein
MVKKIVWIGIFISYIVEGTQTYIKSIGMEVELVKDKSNIIKYPSLLVKYPNFIIMETYSPSLLAGIKFNKLGYIGISINTTPINPIVESLLKELPFRRFSQGGKLNSIYYAKKLTQEVDVGLKLSNSWKEYKYKEEILQNVEVRIYDLGVTYNLGETELCNFSGWYEEIEVFTKYETSEGKIETIEKKEKIIGIRGRSQTKVRTGEIIVGGSYGKEEKGKRNKGEMFLIGEWGEVLSGIRVVKEEEKEKSRKIIPEAIVGLDVEVKKRVKIRSGIKRGIVIKWEKEGEHLTEDYVNFTLGIGIVGEKIKIDTVFEMDREKLLLSSVGIDYKF